MLMALGVAILANTRPWEGTLLCLPVAGVLIWWLATQPHPATSVLLRRAAGPIALLALVAVLMGYYNYRVFGNPLTLPYQVNRATYASAPVFVWESPGPEPRYRHAVMREFYSKWELGDFLYAKTPGGFVSRSFQKSGTALFFFFGPALFAPLFMMPRVLRNRRVRILIGVVGLSAIGLALNAWLFPHYLGPLAGGVYVLLVLCLRYLRGWRRPYGLALVRSIPVVCVLLAGVRIFAAPLSLSIPRWPTMWYGTEPLGLPRARVVSELERYPGKQLAIVRYSANHSVFDDWVYNAADIDNAKVVWTREMGEPADGELLRYFSGRKVWLVQPDTTPPKISPYTDRGPR
jgi:hypothetical protein